MTATSLAADRVQDDVPDRVPDRAPDDAPERAVVLRLRPIVHASPVRDGVHVRGARSSFTMNGGSGLWRLWQAVSVALAGGRSREQLLELGPNPAVRAAVAMMVGQLDEHDMLVAVPPGWGESSGPGDPPERIAGWLAAVAPDPVDAWERLRPASVTVCGTGPVAAAAARALAGAGVTVIRAGAEVTSPVLLATAEVAVSVAVGGEVGFVTPVFAAPSGADDPVLSEAAAIADRIGLSAGAPSPAVLAALVGGAAAHRLVCAIAGLPDPGEDPLADAPSTEAATFRHPTALVARLDPLRAEYHPWLASVERAPSTGGWLDRAAALLRVEALADRETGVLPVLELHDLPQLPAGLARCRVGAGVVCGIGTDAGLARLSAAVGAAEQLAGVADGSADRVVGADATHAEGVLLRRLVHRQQHRRPEGTEPAAAELDAAEWASPEARRWFKAVTLRFGVHADLRVRRLATGVHHAELRTGSELLGWAVESTPTDAAAFCALAAAGALQWRAAGGDPSAVMYAPCGATPTAAADGEAEAETVLQQELRRLLGTRAPLTPVAPSSPLTRALAAAGFVTLEVTP
ncbi:hypothetical protein [Kitasatospora sp. MAP5-34]|uniref:hypothetical protein n=1 Tax=Kitasatospora sp. MAP5-34 TaxID=3035102 RepID=UPI002476A411|nr:hypothetical protein [Kitasatospora sp. MAP5-34]MDH6574907.1 hypothetical protein [Kitasatospora sp. MAP5-34]